MNDDENNLNSMTGFPENQNDASYASASDEGNQYGQADYGLGQEYGQNEDPFQSVLDQPVQTAQAIQYQEEGNKSSKLKWVAIGVLVAGLIGLGVFLFFHFRMTNEQKVFQSITNTYKASSESFTMLKGIDDMEDVKNQGTGEVEVEVKGENPGVIGLYYDGKAKKFLVDANFDEKQFQIYMDDSEISFSDKEKVYFVQFDQIKDKLKDSSIASTGEKQFTDEEVTKIDEAIKELRAFFWDILSNDSLTSEEQKQIYEKFKSSLVIEQKDDTELPFKSDTISCETYDVTVQMDAVTDYLCETVDYQMSNMNEHIHKLLELSATEEALANYDENKGKVVEQIREQMNQVKEKVGNDIHFEVYLNDSKFAGFKTTLTIDGQTGDIEFLCPSGNFFENTVIRITADGKTSALENVADITDNTVKGSIKLTENGNTSELATYQYNCENGECSISCEGQEVFKGKLYYNKEKQLFEIATKVDNNEVSIKVGALDREIQAPSGERHNALEEEASEIQEFSSGLSSIPQLGNPANIYEDNLNNSDGLSDFDSYDEYLNEVHDDYDWSYDTDDDYDYDNSDDWSDDADDDWSVDEEDSQDYDWSFDDEDYDSDWSFDDDQEASGSLFD